jgi:single-stranded DNA-binding protein
MNACIFAGNISRIEAKSFNGESVASFTIAVNDRQGPLWVDCTAWGKTGEACLANLSKGHFVVVNGAVSLNCYLKNGTEPAANLRLNVSSITFGPRRGGAE